MQEVSFDWSNSPNLVKIIVPFFKTLLKIFNIENDFDSIKRRYGLESSRIYTLRELGIYYDCAPSRIQQKEEVAMQRVHEALTGELSLPELEVPDAIKNEIKELRQILKAMGMIITEIEIFSMFTSRYNYSFIPRDAGAIRLLLRTLDFYQAKKQSLPPNIALQPSWITDPKFDEKAFYSKVISTRKVLENHVTPLSSFDLIIECKRSRKKDLNADDLLIIAKICKDILATGESDYQLKFESLSSVADKAYRVLYEANKPLHIREIHKEINHKLAKENSPTNVHSRTLQNQLLR